MTIITTRYDPISAADCAAWKRAYPAQANTPHVCDVITTDTVTATWWGATPSIGPDLVIGGGCVPASRDNTLDDYSTANGPARTYQIEMHTHFHGNTCESPIIDFGPDCWIVYTTIGTSLGTGPTLCDSYIDPTNLHTVARGRYFVSGPFVGYNETQYQDDPWDVAIGYHNYGSPYSG